MAAKLLKRNDGVGGGAAAAAFDRLSAQRGDGVFLSVCVDQCRKAFVDAMGL
ncbi:MAG: hypothetical protein P8176_04650 [Gammaproteobacteria bacterium]